MLKGKWENKAEEVMGLVDAATDAADFVKATEEALRKEQADAFVGLDQENPAVSISFISCIHCLLKEILKKCICNLNKNITRVLKITLLK